MLQRYQYFVFGTGLIIIDQLVKIWATSNAQIFRNYQFAFSTPLPGVVMYLLYAAIMLLIIAYVIARHSIFTAWEKLAWTLVLAGSISNIGERILNGYVKDFIYLFTGVFNLADFYILLGIILLFIVRGKIKHPANI